MIETFAALLFAHVLADFVLQTGWMVANKRKPLVLLLHGLIVLAALQAALGTVSAWTLLALALAHVVIDAAKSYVFYSDGLAPFLADQLMHLATLVATAVMFPTLWDHGLWADLAWVPGVMTICSGLVITLQVGKIAIGKFMLPLAPQRLPRGLANGASIIGVLERAWVFCLVFIDQPAGIGFLIAAKAVLRFDATAKDQSAGEYSFIGTLASFGWALLSSYATLALLGHLPPLGIWPETP